MSSTQDTGVDFVHRIMAEVKVLQEDLNRLHRNQADMQSSLKLEQSNRESDVSALHARISQERAAEALVRGGLEKRLDEFEEKTRNWMGALGKDSVATKEQVTALELSISDRAARQVATDDRRFMALEATLPKKGELADLQKLAAEVDALRSDAERDRNTAAAAVRGAQAAAAADFKLAEERLVKLQDHTETGRRALVADLGALSSKLSNVDAFAQTRAKAADLQALEPRVADTEKSIEQVTVEVKSKAATSTVNSISDRLTSVGMDVQAHGARAQADKETLQASLGKLEKSFLKMDRQADADRERTSACVVALEKELGTKAAKAETDQIGPKTLSTAMDRIESRALELEKTMHQHKQEVPPLRSRVEALEAAFPSRADAAEIPKLHLAIAEHAAKHDALHSRALEHGVLLERVNTDLTRHLGKLEVVENRSSMLERQLATKAEATDHFTKDHTADLLRDFYRREEIDAMLSRVWWRVGDMTKGRTVSGVPISAR